MLNCVRYFRKNILSKRKITIFSIAALIFFFSQFSLPVFAQMYQLPPNYVQNQAAQYQKTIDQFVNHQNTQAPTPTPSPTPNNYASYAAGYAPKNSTDFQLLNLLKQVTGAKTVTLSVLLLGFLLSFPDPFHIFSTQARLNMYHFLISHFPLLSIPIPIPILIPVLFFGPLGILIILGILAVAIYKVARFMILQVLIPLAVPLLKKAGVKFNKSGREKTFLELTFPSDTSKSAYATEQLYILLHTLASQRSNPEKLLGLKKTFSLEIVSGKDTRIRYIIVAPERNSDVLQRSLLSYLPGIKIKKVDDYLDPNFPKPGYVYGVTELKLASHFALPLSKQKTLEEHDPISYLTGNMTKLGSGELISFQVTTTPVLSSTHKDIIGKINNLRLRMYRGQPLTPVLNEGILTKISSLPVISIFALFIKFIFWILKGIGTFIWSMFLGFVDPNSKTIPFLMTTEAIKSVKAQELLNPYEQELQTVVKEKINQKLFETSIRMLVLSKDHKEFQSRTSGLMAFLGVTGTAYQTITTKESFLPGKISMKQRLSQFRQRIVSQGSIVNPNPILSTSEISDLYHFPYTETTKTEDMLTLYSEELPPPHSLKTGAKLDISFGVNMYGGTKTLIGLTEEDRKEHVLEIGRTNSGKSTIIGNCAKDDMKKGRGVAVIDPHGDLTEDLLNFVPQSRKDDLMYCNPIDLAHPMCINLLELTAGLAEDDLALEKELVCEGVIAIFRRVFNDEEKVNAHRIEYILRNTVHTAFTIKGATIFTVYKLLNNPQYQKEITSKLEDENLRDFWKSEFGRAGDWQIVKMVGGVTSRVGRFLFSPIAKRMLDNPKSTINFDQLLENGKILLCNLSEGRLGEDTSHLLGTTIITKIHQAALRRQKIPLNDRKPFYLFVDEFQNFATTSFTKMLSNGRKFGLRIFIAEQTTAQQEDRNTVNAIIANIGTLICFRLASPIDEELILSIFAPYVKKGELMYLPKHHFYIKLGAADQPEPPFSGKTLPFKVTVDKKKTQILISASRKNYTVVYKKPIAPRKVQEKQDLNKKTGNDQKNEPSKRLLPEEEETE